MLASHADGYMEVPWCRKWQICHLNVVSQIVRHFRTWALTSLALFTLLLDGRKPNVTAACIHALTHALSMWRNLTIWQPMHLLTGWFALLPAEGNHVMYDRTMVLILSARKTSWHGVFANWIARKSYRQHDDVISNGNSTLRLLPIMGEHGNAWYEQYVVFCTLYCTGAPGWVMMCWQLCSAKQKT